MEANLLPTLWEVSSLLSKLLVYIAMASIAGASLFLVLYSDNRKNTVVPILYYALGGSFLGFQSSALNYFLQIGMINDSGLEGMFDWSIGKLLLDTQLGDVTLYRLLAFASSFIVISVFLRRTMRLKEPPNPRYFRPFFTMNTLALFTLALSFRLAGHVSVLDNWVQFSIALHVLAFSFWIGSLYPLFKLAQSPDLDAIEKGLRSFGQHAVLILAVLFVSGGVMIWQLLHSLSEFFSSYYGLSLFFKLLIVLIIISIAAYNKLKLVPLISQPGTTVRFQQSVKLEAVIALCVLILTSYLSTIVGPMSH